MESKDGKEGLIKVATQGVISLLIAILMAWSGFLSSSLSKQEERIFAMQRDMVSEAKLNALESRFNSRLESEISNVRREQQETNRYLILIMNAIKGRDTATQ